MTDGYDFLFDFIQRIGNGIGTKFFHRLFVCLSVKFIFYTFPHGFCGEIR